MTTTIKATVEATSDDKKATAYIVRLTRGDHHWSVQHRFSEFEKIYEKVKPWMAVSLSSPPKKKLFGGTDAKYLDRRKHWVESLVADLLASASCAKNAAVREFFSLDTSNGTGNGLHSVKSDYSLRSGDSPPLSPAFSSDNPDDDVTGENKVDLGPSERPTAKPRDFEFLKTVGKGSFGKVFLARHKADQHVYAMKVLGKAHIKKRNEVKHVMSERNVLISNIKHPFLVSLHYSFQTRDKLYFVLDYLNGGELFFHLQREKHFSEPRARFYAAEIASALGYLHDKDIIYRDLKPENLLLDSLGHVVLTDFGLCKEGIKAKDLTATFCGTPEYLAPEVILKKPYDRTVDWWCLGSVLYEMLFGLPPFYSKDHKEMYEKIVHQPLRVSQMVSPGTRDILNLMLQKDRSKRMGAKRDFAEVKEHPFFLAIEWDKLLRREVKSPFVPRVKDTMDTSYIDREFTEQVPSGSLIPSNSYMTSNDHDFQGFTFVESAVEL
uniref:Uncharacterized protein n=1 Tax=Plectus sambesii TaxID=2011161 RepID=A0A914XNT5_9BILA